jgi:PTS system galactitol-specific IIA component
MSHYNVFHEDLIALDLKASGSEEVISALGKLLYQNGYVEDTFIDAVITREHEMATGLPTRPFGVALPHTDCEHVKRTGIAVGILAQPVDFFMMGTPDQQVQAHMVFLMAIREPKKQITLLQKLAELFHKPEILEELRTSKTSRSVVKILKNAIPEEKTDP